MICYHTTLLKNLHSICNNGLLRRSGENSAIIGDKRNGVFFSEGMEGAILLFMTLYSTYLSARNDEGDVLKRYQRVLNGETEPYDIKRLEEQVKYVERAKEADSFESYMGEGIYLQFNKGNIENEGNFIDGYTTLKDIPPEKIDICGVKNNSTGECLFSNFDVIDLMIAHCNREDIIKRLNQLNEGGEFDERIERIIMILDKYMEEHHEKISQYKREDFSLMSTPLLKFLGDEEKQEAEPNMGFEEEFFELMKKRAEDFKQYYKEQYGEEEEMSRADRSYYEINYKDSTKVALSRFHDRLNCGGYAFEIDNRFFPNGEGFSNYISSILDTFDFVRLLGDEPLHDDEYLVFYRFIDYDKNDGKNRGHHFVKVEDDGLVVEKMDMASRKSLQDGMKDMMVVQKQYLQ